MKDYFHSAEAELLRKMDMRERFTASIEARERARCIEAIRTTLANWRCVPSQATREFAELCIREIEK